MEEREKNFEKEEPKFYIDSAGDSLASELHPNVNEDVFLNDPEHKLYAVFDGMGGHTAGEVAAGLAKKYVEENSKLFGKAKKDELEPLIREIFSRMHQFIIEEASKDESKKGMGTTAALVKVVEPKSAEENQILFFAANIGDSRIYHLSRDGEFSQVSLDDDIALKEFGDEATARMFQEKFNRVKDLNELSSIERDLFLRRNILTQALGVEFIEPHIFRQEAEPGDRIIITSDGIHDNLTSQEIAQLVSADKKSIFLVQDLIRAAEQRSKENTVRSKPDDMTALIIKIEKENEQ